MVKRSPNFVFSVRDARKYFFFMASSLPPYNTYNMSSEAKARAAALRLHFEEEMRWVELLEQEGKRAEELMKQEEERKGQEEERKGQEEERKGQEEERRQEALRVQKEKERKRKEVARVLTADQKFVEEKRKKDEVRI